MTPKCGRIDIKYANCSHHTRIGLGKWTHDPTLEQRVRNALSIFQGVLFCMVAQIIYCGGTAWDQSSTDQAPAEYAAVSVQC